MYSFFSLLFFFFFFFNDTATPEIYTLSLHDALPIFPADHAARPVPDRTELDALPHLPDPGVELGPECEQRGDRLLRVGDAPVGEGTGGGVAVGVEAELEAADLESDVERLVEIRFLAEHLGPPRLRRSEVGRG